MMTKILSALFLINIAISSYALDCNSYDNSNLKQACEKSNQLSKEARQEYNNYFSNRLLQNQNALANTQTSRANTNNQKPAPSINNTPPETHNNQNSAPDNPSDNAERIKRYY